MVFYPIVIMVKKMSQNNYHYMIEILTALKNGKTIQVRRLKDWYDIKIENYIPKFNDYEYRIKPEIKSYRIAIMNSHCGDPKYNFPIIVHSEETAIQKQSDPDFVCWRTDWMEY